MNAEEKQVEILSQDSFDRDLTPAEAAKAMKGMFNFDHPDGYNNKIMESVLTDHQRSKHMSVNDDPPLSVHNPCKARL